MSESPAVHVRKSPPQPRIGVYELYWIFASRRQAAFEARLAGKKWPWTDDPILQTYKFCNVFRAADRVSQFMIRDVAYGHDSESRIRDRIFQIVAFRTFSKIETWRGVMSELGGAPRLDHLRNGTFERALDRVKTMTGGLYTGAFILCANKAFGFDEKHRNHVGLFKHMFLEHACAERILQAPSLAAVVELLESFPLLGPFMAYQTAIDLNYSDIIDFSENEYTQAGPGALRGLKKAFITLGDYTPSETILWMVERQEVEFARLGLPFRGLFGRKLHGIDCQGLFCELDKYCREAVPELTSARSRIKAKYIAAHGNLDLFFPPKWDLPSGGVVQTTGEQPTGSRQPRRRKGDRKPDREQLTMEFLAS
jgi:hypothetical protein